MAETHERWEDGPSILRSALRYWWLVVGLAVLGGGLGYAVTSNQPATYDATATLFLSDPNAGSLTARRFDPETYVPQQAERVMSRTVLQRAADQLGEDFDRDDVSDAVEAEPDIAILVIQIHATAGAPETAAAVANAVGNAYQNTARELRLSQAQVNADQLQSVIDDIQARVDELEAELVATADPDRRESLQRSIDTLSQQMFEAELSAQRELAAAEAFGAGVEQFEPALPPTGPSGPAVARNTVLLAMLAGALGVALAYWRAGRTTTVLDRAEPGAILDIPLLGVLPIYRNHDPDAPLDDRIDLSPEAEEAYHFLFSAIEYALRKNDSTSFAVTSARPQDGKTEVSLQLAVAARLDGRDTLLIDGDLRVRNLSRYFEMEDRPGLLDLGRPGEDHREVSRLISLKSSEYELAFLPAGRAHGGAAGLLRTSEFASALHHIRTSHDVTVVDTAPILAVADTTVLAGQVDGLVLAVRRGTDRKVLREVRERLSFVSSEILGYVWITDERGGAGYGYGYGGSTRRAALDGGDSVNPYGSHAETSAPGTFTARSAPSQTSPPPQPSTTPEQPGQQPQPSQSPSSDAQQGSQGNGGLGSHEAEFDLPAPRPRE